MNYGFVRVAAAISCVKVGDCKNNAQQIESLIVQAEGKGAEIICFPELCVTAYTCGDLFSQQLLLDDAEIIVPTKRKYYIETVYSHYEHTMREGQLDATRKIIAESTPEYLDAFDVQMDRNSAHLFNMFIMRKDLLDEYCSWMFPIVGELTKRIDSSDYTPFELRYPGRISEILLDVWLNTKRYPYAEMPIVSPEPVNWMKKGTGFLMAKFVGKKYVKSC